MSRFVPIQEVVDLPMLGNDDILKRSKGRLLKWAKYVWEDLNITTLKVAKRQLFQINKRTNTVDLPCETFNQLCSVSVIGPNGVIYPVFRNDKLHDDITEVAAMKDCACEYKCGGVLCNTIKGYEAITTTKSDFLPNGNPISFTCVDRKSVDGNGFFYAETQYPMRIYESGVWVNTILYTENTKLCKLEVNHRGCIMDTDKNINDVCNACGIPQKDDIPNGGDANSFHNNPQVNTWRYFCNSKLDWFSFQCGNFHNWNRDANNIYNISELGDRLIFPSSFGFDKVLVRWYEDVNLADLQIPLTAVDTFVMGLKWWDSKYNDKKMKESAAYGIQYSKMKWGLLLELNKYRIAEMKQIVSPHVYVPSYNSNIGNRNTGNNY